MAQLQKLYSKHAFLTVLIFLSVAVISILLIKNNSTEAACNSCPHGCTLLFEGECVCSCPPTTEPPTTTTTEPPFECTYIACSDGDCDEQTIDLSVGGMTHCPSDGCDAKGGNCYEIKPCSYSFCGSVSESGGVQGCQTRSFNILKNEECPSSVDCTTCPTDPNDMKNCPVGVCDMVIGGTYCNIEEVGVLKTENCPDSGCGSNEDCVGGDGGDEYSCHVKATATPNPIPTGQSTTTISATNLNHTSLSKCTVSGYSLPHTFTQSENSKTYTVECTGDSGYDSCSSSVTVTKQSTGCSIQLSADKYTVFVNENVKLTAAGSGNIDQNKSIIWHIEDVNNCTQTANWNIDLGIFKICKKVFP